MQQYASCQQVASFSAYTITIAAANPSGIGMPGSSIFVFHKMQQRALYHRVSSFSAFIMAKAATNPSSPGYQVLMSHLHMQLQAFYQRIASFPSLDLSFAKCSSILSWHQDTRSFPLFPIAATSFSMNEFPVLSSPYEMGQKTSPVCSVVF